MGWVKGIFVGKESRLRSGWALLVFLLVSGLVGFGLTWGLKQFGVVERFGPNFGEPVNLLTSLARLLMVLAGSWAGSAALREPFRSAGFEEAHKLRRVGAGVAMGVALISLAVGIPVALRQLVLTGPAADARTLAEVGSFGLVELALAAAAEEVALRGFVFLQLVRGLGKVPALLITSLLFGVLHLTNPNAEWTAAVNIALVGVWMGLLVLGTRSLWLVFGLHTAWNYFEGFVYGQPLSGIALGTTVVRSTAVGSHFWTGGSFGPEAAGWVGVLLGASCVLTFVYFRRRRGAEPPPVASSAAP